MNKKIHFLFSSILLLCCHYTYSTPDRAQLAVWANEAVVATYSYDYKNYLAQQKDIARYFSANAWIAYSKALNASKVPESVQQNNYYVSAVATSPPVLVFLDPTHWQASMNLLVLYSNPQYEQRQYLKAVLNFSQAPSGQGVRGLSIDSLKTTMTKAPCHCLLEEKK